MRMFPQDVIREICRHLNLRTYMIGDVVTNAESGVHFVISGSFVVFDSEQNDVEINHYEDEDTFGSLYDDVDDEKEEKQTHVMKKIVCIESTETYFLSRDNFHYVMSKFPSWKRAIESGKKLESISICLNDIFDELLRRVMESQAYVSSLFMKS